MLIIAMQTSEALKNIMNVKVKGFRILLHPVSPFEMENKVDMLKFVGSNSNDTPSTSFYNIIR